MDQFGKSPVVSTDSISGGKARDSSPHRRDDRVKITSMNKTAVEISGDQSARIAKAIADPQRFAILKAIAAVDELACKKLVEQVPITQATISHHLKELVAAELIHSRRDGQLAMLKCRRDVCEAYVRSLNDQLVTRPSQ